MSVKKACAIANKYFSKKTSKMTMMMLLFLRKNLFEWKKYL